MGKAMTTTPEEFIDNLCVDWVGTVARNMVRASAIKALEEREAAIRADERIKVLAAINTPQEQPAPLICRSCPGDYNVASYVATNHKIDLLWPLCDEHAGISLITGWNPKKIDSAEGRLEIARYEPLPEPPASAGGV